MVRGRIGVAGVSAGLVAAGLLTVGLVTATAAGASSCSASSGKCYLTTVSPQSVAAGDQQQFTFKVTNESTTQMLGSVQITAPSGFVVVGPTAAAPAPPNSVQFLSLGISPRSFALLTVTATVACSGGGSGSWGVAAKQANQFNGTGNDVNVDPASQTSTPVKGSCSLAFVSQPTATSPNNFITNATNSAGSPVSVQVLDGNSPPQRITSSTAPITLSIGTNAGNPLGTLSGPALTVPASGGVASFPDISINEYGTGYTLSASSPSISSPAISNPFDIIPLTACTGVCSLTSSSNTTTVTATSPTNPGQYLGAGVGGTSFTCGTYVPIADPVGFDVLSSTGVSSNSQFSSSITFDQPLPPGRTLSSVQVCVITDYQFTTSSGVLATAVTGMPGYYEGLLPNCPADENGPDGDGDADDSPQNCVLHRTSVGGTVVVTFLAYGDYQGRM